MRYSKSKPSEEEPVYEGERDDGSVKQNPSETNLFHHSGENTARRSVKSNAFGVAVVFWLVSCEDCMHGCEAGSPQEEDPRMFERFPERTLNEPEFHELERNRIGP